MDINNNSNINLKELREEIKYALYLPTFNLFFGVFDKKSVIGFLLEYPDPLATVYPLTIKLTTMEEVEAYKEKGDKH